MFKTLAVFFFVALPLCACGGGKANETFKPDMSTPAGAFEAYKKSIEDMDEKIAAEVFAGDSEYESQMELFRRNVSKYQIGGKRFTVKADSDTASQQADDLAIVRVSLTELGGESNETGTTETRWIAFVKRNDGTLRYDSKATVAIRNKKASEAKAAAPSNAPAPGNTPAPSNAPGSNGG